MSEYDEWAQEQRQRNFLREQERQQRESSDAEARMVGGAVGGILGLFVYLIGLAFILAIYILKYLFIFIVFLRNKFFINWGWYVKTENAIYQCYLWLKKLVIKIFEIFLLITIILPIIYLIKWWELWLVMGVIYLSYFYGK